MRGFSEVRSSHLRGPMEMSARDADSYFHSPGLRAPSCRQHEDPWTVDEIATPHPARLQDKPVRPFKPRLAHDFWSALLEAQQHLNGCTDAKPDAPGTP